MKKQKKIGWQKYEDIIEDQVTNPFIEHIISKMAGPSDTQDISEDFEESFDFTPKDDIIEMDVAMPVSPALIEDLSLAINYDCWVGHTNFDITPSLKKKLSRVEGVEALKIVSRYRFFVGVGRMFKFSDVRKSVETEIEEKTNEPRRKEHEDQGNP
tara:strand:- start:364 stop:831 length:468 start_codon:yes stop_codon:yes gene_type:complete